MSDAGQQPQRTSLGELAALFLRLGTTAFGGPAAHVAMMEELVVRRRGWLTHERFLDLIGAANLIPGPNSTELAIHIGYARRGIPGLVVAGLCFIVPAMLLTGVVAWLYVTYGTLPEAYWLLYGIKPVIVAIVVQALWNLGRSAVKTPLLGAVGAAALAATLLGVHELIVLGAAGAIVAAPKLAHRRAPPATSVALLAPLGVLGAATAPAAAFGLPLLFLTFLKIGSVLFGSGYVLLAFLRADFVDRLHWLTESQLLDAIAAGQITPGPLFSTATFVGYLLGGAAGALVATAGIFLPAFVFVGVSAPFVARLRRSAIAGAILDGVNVASLALMAAVTLALGRASLFDVPTIAIAAIAAVLLVRYRVSSLWLVAGGAALGLLVPLAPFALAKRPSIHTAAPLALPGGTGGIGFDDLRFSPTLHRVLAPAGRTGKLDLIDPKTRAIESVSGFTADKKFGGGHGEGTTSVDEGAGLLFATDRGSREVAVIDPKTKKITSKAKLAANPDYVRWVEPLKEVWVTEPHTKSIEYFTLDKGKLVAKGTIEIAGGPESLVIDAKRARAYTHTWEDETVAIDLAKHAEAARWKNGCKASRGIALDESRGQLFVGCEEGAATMLDVTTGKVLATAPTGKGVDIIAYDPVLSHLYVPGGDDATLTILGVTTKPGLDVLDSTPVAKDAHCVTIDDAHHAYVCDPEHGALLIVTDPFGASR